MNQPPVHRPGSHVQHGRRCLVGRRSCRHAVTARRGTWVSSGSRRVLCRPSWELFARWQPQAFGNQVCGTLEEELPFTLHRDEAGLGSASHCMHSPPTGVDSAWLARGARDRGLLGANCLVTTGLRLHWNVYKNKAPLLKSTGCPVSDWGC